MCQLLSWMLGQRQCLGHGYASEIKRHVFKSLLSDLNQPPPRLSFLIGRKGAKNKQTSLSAEGYNLRIHDAELGDHQAGLHSVILSQKGALHDSM